MLARCPVARLAGNYHCSLTRCATVCDPLLQLGLRGEVRDDFASGRQMVSIEDITPFVREMRERAASGSSAVPDWDKLLIPAEGVLELGESLRVHVGADKVANEAQNRR